MNEVKLLNGVEVRIYILKFYSRKIRVADLIFFLEYSTKTKGIGAGKQASKTIELS